MKYLWAILLITLLSFSTSKSQVDTVQHWNTVHWAVWDNGVPATTFPWKRVITLADGSKKMIHPATHIILFSGKTNGRETMSTPPYFEPCKTNTTPWAFSIRDSAHANGMKCLIDLGFNQSADYCNVQAAGDGAIRTWASTVSRHIVANNFDGGDFDLEGGNCYANIYIFAKYLHDSLSAISPGRKYDLTCDIWNSDVTGWNIPLAAQQGYIDQVNPMWYDQCFPMPSPLYKSSTHSCWNSDSAVAFNILKAGVPKSKIGLGYAIQVYQGCNTCYRYFNNVINLFNGEIRDTEAKATWFTNGTTTIAYEGAYTGAAKANFVIRNGFGGVMGFSFAYGHLVNPPAGFTNDPALDGVGDVLFAGESFYSPPPPPPPANLCDSVCIWSKGYAAGKASVICPGLPDTIQIFNNGRASYKLSVPDSITIRVKQTKP
jgi:hypothetical protein